MLKMWNQVITIIKRKEGATIVEVSFIIPLLFFLIAGVFVYALYVLDFAAVKGDSIMVAQRIGSHAELESFPKLILAKSDGYEIKEPLEQVVVEANIYGKLSWEGLREYMQTKYDSQIKTIAMKDCRKQWMWMTNLQDKKEE